MKKITAIMLAAIMVLSLMGCGGDNAGSEKNQSNQSNAVSMKTVYAHQFLAAFRNQGYKVTDGVKSSWSPKLLGIQKWNNYDYATLYIREADLEKTGACYYFSFENDQDAITAYTQIKDTIKTGMSVQDASTSDGKKCFITKEATNNGMIYVISQVGNTVLMACEQWSIKEDSGKTYDDAIKKIFASLGY